MEAKPKLEIRFLKRQPIHRKEFLGSKAQHQPEKYELITKDTLIMDADTKLPVCLYFVSNDEDLVDLKGAVKSLPMRFTTRTGGMKTFSNIFGYMPRNSLRNNYCRKGDITSKFRRQDEIIQNFGRNLSKIYQSYFPDVFERHKGRLTEIKQEWIIEGTPFTSGIVNKDNPLPYHIDSGNIENVLSCMIVLRHKTGGGHLNIPEYGISLECADGSFSFFDGQGLVHGVTPIYRFAKDSYRYSLVWYTLQQVWKCLTKEEEISRVNKIKVASTEKKLIQAESKNKAKNARISESQS